VCGLTSYSLDDRIISLRGEVWSNLATFYLYKARKLSCHIFVLGVSNLPLSTLFRLHFGNVHTGRYCFVFRFILSELFILPLFLLTFSSDVLLWTLVMM